MRITVFALALIAVVTMVMSPVAWAGDTDPGGAKLRKVVDEYLQSAPANDEKAQKLQAAGGSATDSFVLDAAKVVCAVEMMSLVGLAIWGDRLKADNCGDKLPGLSEYTYCVQYTKACDHFTWSADCLKQQGCLAD